MTNFNLTTKEQKETLNALLENLITFYNNTNTYKVAPTLDIDLIKKRIAANNFEQSISPSQALKIVVEGLKEFSVHTTHPKYFGLFNPRANFPSILSDLIVAFFNPQLAAWSHAPFATEIENYVLQAIGQKFGYALDERDGVFATGGAEANLTAVLCALNDKFEHFAEDGVLGLSKRPIIYCSAEAHHSIDKAARTVGLGYASVKSIAVDAHLKMNLHVLKKAIEEDIDQGHLPFMLVGTAGTTGTGAIDDLEGLKKIAEKFDLWFHADAAYGGGAILSQQLKPLFKGIESSDSITFDAHKWMSVGMGTSLFLTSKKHILSKTFRITTEYMPKEANELEIVDPFTHSIQWSRRFIGLKVFIALQIFGWKGYEEIVDHQTNMGNLLRVKLKEQHWSILNDTALPVICFTDPTHEQDANFARSISRTIIGSGKSWLSVYPIRGISTLRVCITNYDTQKVDIENLVVELNEARDAYHKNNRVFDL